MAKTSGNNRGKQGIVSWITSVIALGIGFSNVFSRIYDASTSRFGGGSKLAQFGELMLSDYTGLKVNLGSDLWGVGRDVKFDLKSTARGYAPIVGAVAFKKGTSYLVKTAPIRSLIPSLHMG